MLGQDASLRPSSDASRDDPPSADQRLDRLESKGKCSARRTMAGWKERGYVPDSDDEDDAFDSNLSPTSVLGGDDIQPPPKDDNLSPSQASKVTAKPSLDFDVGSSRLSVEFAPKTSNDTAQPDGLLPGTHHQSLDDSEVVTGPSASARESNKEDLKSYASRPRNISQISSLLSNDQQKSTSQKLHEVLQLGLRTTAEVLQGTPHLPKPQSTGSSRSSSPLSSLGSLPDEDEIFSRASVKEKSHNATVSSRSEEYTEADLPVTSRQQPARQLRQRNPIQIHPFALEDARYRQISAAHGVKPLRILPDNHAPRKAANPDSQEEEVFSSSPVDESQTQSALHPSQNTETDEVWNGNAVESLLNDDAPNYKRVRPRPSLSPSPLIADDLPDVSALLQGDISAVNKPPHKKRKAAHTYSRKNQVQTVPDELRTFEFPPGSPRWSVDRESASLSHGIPLSPPRSSSMQPPQHPLSSITDIQPRLGMTPQALPTPILSSVIRTSVIPSVEMITSSPSSHRIDHSRASSQSRSSSPATNEDDGDGSRIHTIQRKMKGVLPASWLKLDLKNQNAERLRRQSSGSPLKSADLHGLAQRLQKRARPLQYHRQGDDHAIIVSDNSMSSEDSLSEDGVLQGPFSPSLDFENGGFRSVHDDLEEDNRVDMMAPPGSRTRPAGRPPKRRRRKTVQDVGLTGHGESPLGRKSKAKKQSKIIYQSTQSLKCREHRQDVTPPLLGILDAPGFLQLGPAQQPRFLRIAARQARARKHKGRQSPSKKYLRLAGSKDTQDVNADLVNWRGGRIRPQAEFKQLQPQHASAPLPPSRTSFGSQTRPTLHTSTRLKRQTLSNTNSTEATINEILRGQTRIPVKERSSLLQPLTGPLQPVTEPEVGQSRFHNRSGKGKLVSSFIRLLPTRSAQFETLQTAEPGSKAFSTFRAGLTALNRKTLKHTATTAPFGKSSAIEPSLGSAVRPKATVPNIRRIPPKRNPRRFDLGATGEENEFGYHTKSQIGIAVEDSESTFTQRSEDNPAIQLINLNMNPLRMGTRYHEQTFIGSGGLASTVVQTSESRDFSYNYDSELGVVDTWSGTTYVWHSWNENVGAELCILFKGVELRIQEIVALSNEALSPNSASWHPWVSLLTESLQHVIKYINIYMYFEQATDRVSFVRISLPIVKAVAQKLESLINTATLEVVPSLLHVMNHLVVFAAQVRNVASDSSVIVLNDRIEAAHLSEIMVKHAIAMALRKEGQQNLLRFFERNQQGYGLGAGIMTLFPEVDTFVIFRHLHDKSILWDLVKAALNLRHYGGGILGELSKLEDHCNAVTVVVPLLAINSSGYVSQRSYVKDDVNGWACAGPAIENFLRLYTTVAGMQIALNASNGRRLSILCFQLANEWGWIKCQEIIEMWMGYFKRNKMNELFGETPNKSPDFLNDLTLNTEVFVDENDSAFHSTLKLVFSNLRSTAGRESSRIQSYIMRLCPNSGPIVGKEVENLTTRDLIPLRNRHDLFSVLYCAVSEKYRPRITLIQDLVDFSLSHFNACRINLDTWTRLVRFNLSSDTVSNDLIHCESWIRSKFDELVGAFDKGIAGVNMSDQNARDVLAAHQLRAASPLIETLNVWEDGIRRSRLRTHPEYLMFPGSMQKLLGSCDPDSYYSEDVMEAILRLVHTFIDKSLSLARDDTEQIRNVLGWMGVDNPPTYIVPDFVRSPLSVVDHPLHLAIQRFFGSQFLSDDKILKLLADCWFDLAQMYVFGERVPMWDLCINEGMEYSCHSFPQTPQSRDFSLYLLARIIRQDPSYYHDRRIEVLRFWVTRMLVPNYRLKFHDALLRQILDHDPSNPLLIHCSSALGERTVEELKHAQTSIIKTVIQNIHNFNAPANHSQAMMENMTQEDCVTILNDMMEFMKSMWLGIRDRGAQQEYTKMIHEIVEQMQRYTCHLLPLGSWFSNNNEFPAQSQSVTSKLRTYAFQLTTTGVTKEMATFFQVTCERNAIEGSQSALLHQLQITFLDLSEENLYNEGNDAVDVLFRTSFFETIFPVYVDLAFTGPGPILALPILSVLQIVYRDLYFHVGIWTVEHLRPLTAATLAIFAAANRALKSTTPDKILASADQCRVLAALIQVFHSIMLRCQDLSYSFEEANFLLLPELWEYLEHFARYLRVMSARSFPSSSFTNRRSENCSHQEEEDDRGELAEPALTGPNQVILQYAKKELAAVVEGKWKREGAGEGGGWVVWERGMRKRILGRAAESGLEAEKERLEQVLRDFLDVFDRLE